MTVRIINAHTHTESCWFWLLDRALCLTIKLAYLISVYLVWQLEQLCVCMCERGIVKEKNENKKNEKSKSSNGPGLFKLAFCQVRMVVLLSPSGDFILFSSEHKHQVK